jgi:predicted DNA-binding protein (MmcQ/YjbR family)
MGSRTREDRRLRLLSAVCLALPETERTNCGAHADFRVRGKIFAYFLRNHGGDGVTAACFKTRLGEHVEHVKQAPERFYLPHFIGRRGWLGVRLDQGEINWDEIKALVAVSYNLAAPRTLRAPSVTAENALTSRSLVRGAPPAGVVDASVLTAQRMAEVRSDAIQPLRPTAVPETASGGRSGGLRGRR